jgi:hypothetical protein
MRTSERALRGSEKGMGVSQRTLRIPERGLRIPERALAGSEKGRRDAEKGERIPQREVRDAEKENEFTERQEGMPASPARLSLSGRVRCRRGVQPLSDGCVFRRVRCPLYLWADRRAKSRAKAPAAKRRKVNCWVRIRSFVGGGGCTSGCMSRSMTNMANHKTAKPTAASQATGRNMAMSRIARPVSMAGSFNIESKG